MYLYVCQLFLCLIYVTFPKYKKTHHVIHPPRKLIHDMAICHERVSWKTFWHVTVQIAGVNGKTNDGPIGSGNLHSEYSNIVTLSSPSSYRMTPLGMLLIGFVLFLCWQVKMSGVKYTFQCLLMHIMNVLLHKLIGWHNI